MTSKYEPTVEQQRAMVEYLAAAVVGDATGESHGDRCIGEPPSARYYLGTLAPRGLNLAASRQRRGRDVPDSLGFEFEVADHGILTANASLSCYYRVLPTFAEQLESLGDVARNLDPAADYRLAPVFKRIEVSVAEIRFKPRGGNDTQHLAEEEFHQVFTEAAQTAAADPTVNRRVGEERGARRVPASALGGEGAFEEWKRGLDGVPVVPAWKGRFTVMSRLVGAGRTRLMVMLENLSDDPQVRKLRSNDTRHDDERDHFLFRVRLEVIGAPGRIVPIEMDLGPDAFRYDPRLWAYATNCGVAHAVDEDGRTHLFSVPAPESDTTRAFSKDHPAANFEGLATNPLPALHDLASAMRAYTSDPEWGTATLSTEMAERKAADLAAFESEIARFEDGVRWLEKDERLLLAFKLANETMGRLAKLTRKPHKSWRLFQLVFIVSQLPALAWREHPPEEFAPGLWGGSDGDPTAAATVLWFPTAGGKTEAYIGLTACALFYDRARGKARGVTAWCRFPLRLLSLQQTQRQVDFIAAADQIREERQDLLVAVGGQAGDPFTVGFYVGEGNTPNSLSRDPGVLARLREDAGRRRDVRVLDECPFCRERAVEVEAPDPVELRLRHRCTACGRSLPIVVVDTELYRYLPAVIVGTLDKLALIGLSDRFGAILGDVDCECSLHGFGRGEKCHERRATGHPKGTITRLTEPLYDASPSLEIIDELHMVDEELGAFTGHYEGLLAHAQRVLSARARRDGRGMRMKVIATTATIKGEDRQCEHLFGLPSTVFPLPGPSLTDSFYWRVDDEAPLRRFVGVLPHRATAELTLVRILQSLHLAIRRLEKNGATAVPALGAVTTDQFDDIVDLYRVSLTYVTSKVDFGKLSRSMETQVNETMRQRGERSVKVAEMWAETDFDDVRSTLDDLTSGGPTEAVIGTSMVSHGVDVERLNLMVFNGMPKSIAEYIQASSRVGRRYFGCVFMIFNPIRERDRSHFRYHSKFHEYLDRMVAPVAINRWSRYAAERTLPGVLMGEILQELNREYWAAGGVPHHLHNLDHMKRAIRPLDAGGIAGAQVGALTDAMREVYLTDWGFADELRGEIVEGVRHAVDSIRAAGAASGAASRGRPQYRGTGDHLGLAYEPMLSLRDVAEGIPFFTLPDRRR